MHKLGPMYIYQREGRGEGEEDARGIRTHGEEEEREESGAASTKLTSRILIHAAPIKGRKGKEGGGTYGVHWAFHRGCTGSCKAHYRRLTAMVTTSWCNADMRCSRQAVAVGSVPPRGTPVTVHTAGRVQPAAKQEGP